MNMRHRMYAELESKSENEAYARVIVAAFCARLNPTIPELEDVKMAVSEAVTNAIIHGYPEGEGVVHIEVLLEEDVTKSVLIKIWDDGVGIEDVSQAMEPLFTTKPDEERSGMGFAFMEIMMDELNVESIVGKGTCISMKKKIN